MKIINISSIRPGNKMHGSTYLLTCFRTWFSRSIHSDFDGFIVSGNLRGWTAHSYGQRKTFACNVNKTNIITKNAPKIISNVLTILTNHWIKKVHHPTYYFVFHVILIVFCQILNQHTKLLWMRTITYLHI